jgi:hypothetical protein
VSAAADGMAEHPEDEQNEADNQHDDADRPEDGDLRDEPDNEQDNAEDDQLWLLAGVATPSVRVPTVAVYPAEQEGRNLVKLPGSRATPSSYRRGSLPARASADRYEIIRQRLSIAANGW